MALITSQMPQLGRASAASKAPAAHILLLPSSNRSLDLEEMPRTSLCKSGLTVM